MALSLAVLFVFFVLLVLAPNYVPGWPPWGTFAGLVVVFGFAARLILRER